MQPSGKPIQVDLRVVPAESWGAAWQYFTGSKEHNVHLRERAVKCGWSLNEYALTDAKTKKVIASAKEKDIYDALDLPHFPPEWREDRGEFELESIPRDLIKLDDLRGDLHMHTTASDGKCSVEEMAHAARDRGYDYICITDHSEYSAIANGLSPDWMRRHIHAVRGADKKIDGIKIWIGSEVDILPDGSLDYDDDLLAEMDFVVASIHYAMGNDIELNTKRTIAAIRNPYVNLIGHPSGRLINKREAMPLDIERICEAAAETGTALEINANAYRLDLKDQHARLAREKGVTLSINCDAHHTDQFDQARFGVMTARRAWTRKGEVLNTWPPKKIREFVQKKRDKYA